MEKIFILTVETIDTDEAVLMSKNVMATSNSVDLLKQHFEEINNSLLDGYEWNIDCNGQHSIYIAGSCTCTIIIIEEVKFLQ